MKALCFVLAAAAALVLVSPREVEAQSAPKAAESPKEDFVTEKGFASRGFEVKHRDPSDLATVLRPLGSGYKGATSPRTGNSGRSACATSENIAAMEAALKRLTRPRPRKPTSSCGSGFSLPPTASGRAKLPTS